MYLFISILNLIQGFSFLIGFRWMFMSMCGRIATLKGGKKICRKQGTEGKKKGRLQTESKRIHKRTPLQANPHSVAPNP